MYNEENNQNLGNLEQSLSMIEKPKLSSERKIVLRDNIMRSLNSNPESSQELRGFASLVAVIKKVVSEGGLSYVQKARIKERVFSLIEQRSQKSFFWPKFFVLFSKSVALVLVLAMFTGVFAMMGVQTRVVSAASFTVIDDFKGEVYVLRNGDLLNVYDELILQVGDKIVTKENSFASIRYFDDSVSRLAANTELVVDELSRSSENSVSSYVEVNLENGVVWSKVVNLLESDSSFVVRADNVSAKAQKGAFNVKLDAAGLEIGVFNNAVEIESKESVSTVFKGEKVLVDSKSKEVRKSFLPVSEQDDKWVQDNLKSDKQYLTEVEKRLVGARLKALGVDDVKDVSLDNTLSENALLFLTFDDVDKGKLDLDLAEKDFVVAQVKLQDGNLSSDEKSKIEGALSDFESKVRDFYAMIDDVATTDPEYALELKSYVDSKILSQKKDMSLVLPDSPAYAAKEVLGSLEFLMAKDNEHLLSIKNKHASEKVATIEQLLDNGDYNLANNLISEYKGDLDGVVDFMDSGEKLDPVAKKKASDDIAKDMKLLDVATINIRDNLRIDAAKANIVQAAPVLDGAGATAAASSAAVAVPALSAPAVSAVEISIEGESQTTVAPLSAVTREEEPDEEAQVDGPFGIRIQGDKPLDPLLNQTE